MVNLVSNKPKKLRVLILDCPYDTWDSPLTRELFAKMVALKLHGYQAEYPYTVLPVDTADFVATHLLVCIEDEAGFHPIYGHKSITLERCDAFRLSFPAIGLALSTGNDQLRKSLERIIHQARVQRKTLIYTGSRTQDPRFNDDSEMKPLLKSLFRLMHVSFCESHGSHEEIVGATTRFNSEKTLLKWGFEELTDFAGRTFGPIKLPLIFNETVLVLHKKKPFPAVVASFTPELQRYWDERLVISAPVPAKKIIKKAA